MPRLRIADKPLYDLVLLALAFALLFALDLGERPYSAPSEARYIEIGREMAESGDYVTPRLDYVKYFEKPPLFYWAQAINTKILGVGPFVSRIPTAKFAVLLCLITYGLGRMLYGRLAGVLSSLMLGTSLYLFALSRVVLVDLPVSVFITATLTAFLYVVDAPEGRRRTIVLYIMYAAAACAMLSKGLIGIVLPGGVALAWMILTGRFALIKTLRLPTGLALFALIAAPWHILVAMRNPEFLHFYFIHEHFERYTSTVHKRYQPDWFFFAVLLAGLFPWFVFAPQAVGDGLKSFWQDRKSNGAPLFLLLWIALIFVFFSLSDSKLIPYILPIFPAIAVLFGRYLAQAWQEQEVFCFRSGVLATGLLLIAIALTPSVLHSYMDPLSKVMIAMAQAPDAISTLSFTSMALAGLLLLVYVQGRAKHVIMTIIFISAVVLELGDTVAAHYNKDSMAELAGKINAMHDTKAEVVSYHVYFQDLPIYLDKRITIVDWLGELEFGSQHEDDSAWIIDDKTFWKRWLKNDHTMFVIMRDESYTALTKGKDPEKDLHLYGGVQDNHNLLFVNHILPPPPARK